MLKNVLNRVVIVTVTVLFTGVFSWWLSGKFPVDITERIPGMDNRPKMISESDEVNIGQFFDFYGKLEDSVQGSWPRFRGK